MNDKLRCAFTAASEGSTAFSDLMNALTGAFDGNEWTDELKALFLQAHQYAEAVRQIEDWLHESAS